MHSMAEWYIRGENDQTRLTRILEVAQDLKVCSLFDIAMKTESYKKNTR